MERTIICNKCHKEKTLLELSDARKYNCRRLCFPCERQRQKDKQKRAYLSNPEKQKEIAVKSYRKYRDKNKLAQKNRREKLKLDVLTHYSGGTPVCNCCGEKHLIFLTIDHINGGGTKDRKNSGGGGHHFYRQIIVNNYPPDYQVLCFNCNFAKSRPGGCPHKHN